MNEVAHDGFDPGVLAGAKEDRGPFLHFEMIHGGAREEIAEDFDLFHHGLADMFFGDFLHGGGDELEVALVSNLELDLIPDIRKERPGIVVNGTRRRLLVRPGQISRSARRESAERAG